MVATAAEEAFREVLDMMDELEMDEDPSSYDTYLMGLPGPNQTGELGVIFNSDEDDEDEY